MEYLDFNVTLDRGTGEIFETRLTAPSGEAQSTFAVPFEKLELENFLLRMGRSRVSTVRRASPERKAARHFGATLFDALIDDEIRPHLRRSLDMAATEEKGLRIRIRIGTATELLGLPWEFLYDDHRGGQFLALSDRTPLVRYLNMDGAPRRVDVESPLRVMVVSPSPTGVAPIDHDGEVARLTEVLGPQVSAGAVEIVTPEQQTLTGLQRALRRGEFHVLHFIGHGGFDEATGEGILMFEREDGSPHPVDAALFATIVGDHEQFALAVLNACDGARTSADDPFAGIAQRLLASGLPAAIGMQFEVSDDAALRFAQDFYAALVDGYPVDAAVSEARKALMASGHDTEWGTPALYMRSRTGEIFDFVDPPPSARTPSADPPRPSPGHPPGTTQRRPVPASPLAPSAPVDTRPAARPRASTRPAAGTNQWRRPLLAVAFLAGLWIVVSSMLGGPPRWERVGSGELVSAEHQEAVGFAVVGGDLTLLGWGQTGGTSSSEQAFAWQLDGDWKVAARVGGTDVSDHFWTAASNGSVTVAAGRTNQPSGGPTNRDGLIAWTIDGTSWTTVQPDAVNQLAGPQDEFVRGIVPLGRGFVAAGWADDVTAVVGPSEKAPADVAVWRSDDGMEWVRVDPSGFRVEGDQAALAIAANGSGAVLGGRNGGEVLGTSSSDPNAPNPADASPMFMYSPDGVGWEWATIDSLPADDGMGRVWGIVWDGERYVAVGHIGPVAARRGSIWTSDDEGRTWQQAHIDDVDNDFRDVAANDDGYVIVGHEWVAPGSAEPRIWQFDAALSERSTIADNAYESLAEEEQGQIYQVEATDNGLVAVGWRQGPDDPEPNPVVWRLSAG